LATKEEVIAGSIWETRLDHIVKCIEQAFTLDSAVIVQEAVQGTEITVAVLEDPDARALPVIEIVMPQGAWYDYEHKYSVGRSKHIIPARLPDWVANLAQQFAVAAHRNLGCRDLSRVDFIVSHPETLLNKHSLWFLEVNTLPGFTNTSLFPDAAKAAHITMPEMVRRLVLNAWARR
jgi:D-alanine-D-alanine ligase